jgi:hypothetical protein
MQWQDLERVSSEEFRRLMGKAWLNADNRYVLSDDPNFNPNAQLSGSWNQLQPVPP